MPKKVRGILGKYADPKKPLLFSFTSQNWPSDDEDSDDTDYTPSDIVDEMEVNTNSQKTGNVQELQKNGKKGDSRKHHASAKKGAAKQNWVVSNGTNEGGGMKLKIKRDENSMKGRKRKKEKPLKDPDKKVKRKKSESTSEKGAAAEDFVEGPWGKFLPLELLVRIFREGFNLEGVFPFLHRVQQVCLLWRRASMDRLMWEYVDLSSDMIRKSDFFLKELFEERDFSFTKRINLSGWGDNLTFEGIKRIASTCPLLTSINLMGCISLKAEGIKRLVDSCPSLSHIDISRISYKASSNTTNPINSLKYIFEKCAAHLIYLNISENTVGNLATIIKSLAEHCPNLEVLDACNLSSSSNIVLPVEEFQVGCPKIRVLRLANCHVSLLASPLSAQVKAPGFPELEELSIAEVENKLVPCQLGDNDLERLLKSSHKLRLLDVRGCHNISVSGLVRLPAWDIQQLYLTRCAATRSPDLELVLKKWSHSLKNVDLSWANDANAIDQGIIALASVEGQSHLEVVDICGSAVSYSSIQKLLEKCSRLQSLNLQSCRSLPRGIKRFYSGPELVRLKETI